MGTWGFGSFENDSALDFVGDLEETDDLSLLEEILDIKSLKEGIDESVGPDILVACEIVAAMLGRPRVGLPEEVSVWIDTHKDLDAYHLTKRSLVALDAVLSPESGLCQLWSEADDFDVWKGDVAGLKARIKG